MITATEQNQLAFYHGIGYHSSRQPSLFITLVANFDFIDMAG